MPSRKPIAILLIGCGLCFAASMAADTSVTVVGIDDLNFAEQTHVLTNVYVPILPSAVLAEPVSIADVANKFIILSTPLYKNPFVYDGSGWKIAHQCNTKS